MTMMDAMAGEVLRGWYDYRLVALLVVIAVLASYVALDLAGRVTNAQGRTKVVWLCGGATAMGSGIWSMHYVGMLAFRLPVPVLYDWPTVGVSLLAAILASVIALFVVSRKKMGIAAALTGSVCMGAAIADGYVSKPIRTNELYAALEKTVKKEEQSEPENEEIVPTASVMKQYAERNDS